LQIKLVVVIVVVVVSATSRVESGVAVVGTKHIYAETTEKLFEE